MKWQWDEDCCTSDYDFRFIAVEFEEDYFLLNQAFGEELAGAIDNELSREVEPAAGVVNFHLFMEIY